MNRKLRYVSALAAMSLVLGSSAMAFAGSVSTIESTPTTECATTTISPGPLSASSANFTGSTKLTLDGSSHTVTLTGSGTVDDYTGMGEGWTVNETGSAMTLVQLASAAENPAALGSTLATTLSGNTSGSGITGSTVNLPPGGVIETAAVGHGMGVTTYGETLAFTVPPTAYAGVYATTVTVQADEGLPATPSSTTTTYSCTNSGPSDD